MTQKISHLEADVRNQIAQTLPIALSKAIESYQNYLDNPSVEEATDFKNQHAACKAALAHIELILKLSNMVDIEDDGQIDAVAELLKNAQKELEGRDE